jgi:hypothetical protein
MEMKPAIPYCTKVRHFSKLGSFFCDEKHSLLGYVVLKTCTKISIRDLNCLKWHFWIFGFFFKYGVSELGSGRPNFGTLDYFTKYC